MTIPERLPEPLSIPNPSNQKAPYVINPTNETSSTVSRSSMAEPCLSIRAASNVHSLSVEYTDLTNGRGAARVSPNSRLVAEYIPRIWHVQGRWILFVCSNLVRQIGHVSGPLMDIGRQKLQCSSFY